MYETECHDRASEYSRAEDAPRRDVITAHQSYEKFFKHMIENATQDSEGKKAQRTLD